MKKQKKSELVLNLKGLDKSNLAYAFDVIANFMRRRLSAEEVREVYNQGLPVLFRGGAPSCIAEENYVLSYNHRAEDTPKLRVNCFFSTSGHRELMNKGSPLVAGTLAKGRFNSYSSTWMKQAYCGNPAYNFGESVNKIMLNHFRLK